jgi:hypothetical protein
MRCTPSPTAPTRLRWQRYGCHAAALSLPLGDVA